MPLPIPQEGESRDEFIARAMGNEHMKSKWPKSKYKQRLAVVFSQWSEKDTVEKMGEGKKSMPLPFARKKMKQVHSSFIKKFNQNHDSKTGRFSSGKSGGSSVGLSYQQRIANVFGVKSKPNGSKSYMEGKTVSDSKEAVLLKKNAEDALSASGFYLTSSYQNSSRWAHADGSRALVMNVHTPRQNNYTVSVQVDHSDDAERIVPASAVSEPKKRY